MKIIRKTMGTAISARPNYYQSRNNLSLKADFREATNKLEEIKADL